MNPSHFLLFPPRPGMSGHTYRILQGPSRLRRGRGAFSVCVVIYWNRLAASTGLSQPVLVFKTPLDNNWSVIFPEFPVYCVISFVKPLNSSFTLIVTPRILMILLFKNYRSFCVCIWLLLALAANLSINKCGLISTCSEKLLA